MKRNGVMAPHCTKVTKYYNGAFHKTERLSEWSVQERETPTTLSDPARDIHVGNSTRTYWQIPNRLNSGEIFTFGFFIALSQKLPHEWFLRYRFQICSQRKFANLLNLLNPTYCKTMNYGICAIFIFLVEYNA
jgi:hypothetical protein